MKKRILFIAAALLLVGILFTSCNPYTGNYYKVTYGRLDKEVWEPIWNTRYENSKLRAEALAGVTDENAISVKTKLTEATLYPYLIETINMREDDVNEIKEYFQLGLKTDYISTLTYTRYPDRKFWLYIEVME